MDLEKQFQKLRTFFLEPPSVKAWESIWSYLCEQPKATREMLAFYAYEHLQHWPPEYLLVPEGEFVCYPNLQQLVKHLCIEIKILKSKPKLKHQLQEKIHLISEIPVLTIDIKGPSDYYAYSYGVKLLFPELESLQQLRIQGTMHHIVELKGLERITSLQSLHIENLNYQLCKGSRSVLSRWKNLKNLQHLAIEPYHPSGHVHFPDVDVKLPKLPSLRSFHFASKWIEDGCSLDLSNCPTLEEFHVGLSSINHITWPKDKGYLKKMAFDFCFENQFYQHTDPDISHEGTCLSNQEFPSLQELSYPYLRSFEQLPKAPLLKTLQLRGWSELSSFDLSSFLTLQKLQCEDMYIHSFSDRCPPKLKHVCFRRGLFRDMPTFLGYGQELEHIEVKEVPWLFVLSGYFAKEEQDLFLQEQTDIRQWQQKVVQLYEHQENIEVLVFPRSRHRDFELQDFHLFARFPQLRGLNLSEDYISSLDGLEKLESLEFLALGGSFDWSQETERFSNLKNVKKLWLHTEPHHRLSSLLEELPLLSSLTIHVDELPFSPSVFDESPWKTIAKESQELFQPTGYRGQGFYCQTREEVERLIAVLKKYDW